MEGRGLDTMGPKMSRSSLRGALEEEPLPPLEAVTAGVSGKGERSRRRN